MGKRRREDEEVVVGASAASNERKRVRSSDDRPKSTGSRRGTNSRAAVEKLLDNSTKDLTKALKLAKGFERQRLGKRLKGAAEKHDETLTERLNAEIQAVKTLENRSELAQSHLYKVLLKNKKIRDSPNLPSYVKILDKPESDAILLNVTARLYNANVVKTAVDKACHAIREAMGLDEELGLQSNGKKDPERSSGVRDDYTSTVKSPSDDESLLEAENHSSEDDDRELAGFEQFAEGTQESLHRAAEVLSERSMSLGSSDAISSDGIIKPAVAVSKGRPRLPTEELYSSKSPSPNLDLSSDESEPESKPIKAAVKLKPTHYLPALTHVGYISGSDSEPEDVDDLVAPRKNRRGQRARQQIWEQKYGQKAKHLHQEMAKRDRNAGWDARYGARAGDEGGRGRNGKGRDGMRGAGSSNGAASGANEVSIEKPRALGRDGLQKNKRKDDDGKLHPSWEAKKLAKKKANMLSFTGKKISFE